MVNHESHKTLSLPLSVVRMYVAIVAIMWTLTAGDVDSYVLGSEVLLV